MDSMSGLRDLGIEVFSRRELWFAVFAAFVVGALAGRISGVAAGAARERRRWMKWIHANLGNVITRAPFE